MTRWEYRVERFTQVVALDPGDDDGWKAVAWMVDPARLAESEHPFDDIPKVVGLNHLLHRDPELRSLLDLPIDWEAERQSVGVPRQRRKASIE